jgi:exosome complex component RRP4
MKNEINASSEEQIQIVLPGDIVHTGIDFLAGQGTYRDNDTVKSKYLGILRKQEHSVKVIPLSGKYVPEVGDFVIGEVDFVNVFSWKIIISSAYTATLPLSEVQEFIEKGSDLSRYYKRGDLIFAKISSVSVERDIVLSMKDRSARKLYGGRVIKITSNKVPRVIGRKGTMVNTIKDKTGCIITVGQNGFIWVKGENTNVVAKAIEMIENQSHEAGLTDKVSGCVDKWMSEINTQKTKTNQDSKNEVVKNNTNSTEKKSSSKINNKNR